MKALQGIKIIDFSKWLPGQYASMVLADFGAEVIHVEDIAGDGTRAFFPDKEKGMSYWHLALNRNKKGVSVDIRTPEGQEIMHRLLKAADVFLEGFRPGYLATKGLDYAAVSAENPRLVYASVTGFGQNGKYRHKPAHDLNVIGLAGLAFKDVETGGATMVDVQMSALGAAFNTVSGILLALLARERTGRGQQVDVSLFGSALQEQITTISSLWGSAEQGTKPFGRFAHYYNIYETKDNRFIACGTLEPKFWRKCCELIGREDLAARQYDFAHEDDYIAILQEAFRTKTQAEWLALIGDEEYCVTPICSLEEALASDYAADSGLLSETQDDEFGRLRYVGSPIKLSETPAAIDRRAPRLGEDTQSVLLGIGYNEAELEELREKKVIL